MSRELWLPGVNICLYSLQNWREEFWNLESFWGRVFGGARGCQNVFPKNIMISMWNLVKMELTALIQLWFVGKALLIYLTWFKNKSYLILLVKFVVFSISGMGKSFLFGGKGFQSKGHLFTPELVLFGLPWDHNR